jgi:predicted nuclease of predicted toxin-antitoxin system
MKILLDHNLPKQLRSELSGHLVFTARQMSWDALSNGRLLAAAEADGFQLLVTGDQSMYSQQNHASRRIAILVLTSTLLPRLRTVIEEIRQSVDRAEAGGYEVFLVSRRSAKRGRPSSV